MTFRNALKRVQPSSIALSSNDVGIDLKYERMNQSANGSVNAVFAAIRLTSVSCNPTSDASM